MLAVMNCSKCGEEKPLSEFYLRSEGSLNRQCKSCVKSRVYKRRDDHPEKIKAEQKAYREANPDKVLVQLAKFNAENPDYRREYNAAYRQKNKERLNARSRDYYSQNREQLLAWSAEYRAANKAIIAGRKRKYREENRERLLTAKRADWHRRKEEGCQFNRDADRSREASRRRRAQKRNAECYEISLKEWNRIVQRYHGKCAYCGVKPWTQQDHVIPLSRGGSHGIGNLLPACDSCNSSKHANYLVEWRYRKAAVVQWA